MDQLISHLKYSYSIISKSQIYITSILSTNNQQAPDPTTDLNQLINNIKLGHIKPLEPRYLTSEYFTEIPPTAFNNITPVQTPTNHQSVTDSQNATTDSELFQTTFDYNLLVQDKEYQHQLSKVTKLGSKLTIIPSVIAEAKQYHCIALSYKNVDSNSARERFLKNSRQAVLPYYLTPLVELWKYICEHAKNELEIIDTVLKYNDTSQLLQQIFDFKYEDLNHYQALLKKCAISSLIISPDLHNSLNLSAIPIAKIFAIIGSYYQYNTQPSDKNKSLAFKFYQAAHNACHRLKNEEPGLFINIQYNYAQLLIKANSTEQKKYGFMLMYDLALGKIHPTFVIQAIQGLIDCLESNHCSNLPLPKGYQQQLQQVLNTISELQSNGIAITEEEDYIILDSQ